MRTELAGKKDFEFIWEGDIPKLSDEMIDTSMKPEDAASLLGVPLISPEEIKTEKQRKIGTQKRKGRKRKAENIIQGRDYDIYPSMEEEEEDYDLQNNSLLQTSQYDTTTPPPHQPAGNLLGLSAPVMSSLVIEEAPIENFPRKRRAAIQNKQSFKLLILHKQIFFPH